MRLGVSNLAWAAEATAPILGQLAAQGVSGIEVAPTRIAPWPELSPQHLRPFRALCAGLGLAIPSLQAIFHGCPEAQLLQDAAGFAAMCAHLHQVGAIAEALGARVAVVGAARNRGRGALGEADALARALPRLARLGEIAASHGLTLALEPVPTCYGCDFMPRAEALLGLVRAVGHPAIRFQMDCACVMLSGDDPAEAIAAAGELMVHYHAAEPDLGGFTNPTCNHDSAAAALRRAGYAGWVVIEMAQIGPTGGPALDEAVRRVGGWYDLARESPPVGAPPAGV